MARVAVLEQFSGRNLGDTASLGVIAEEVLSIDPDAVFDVYSVLGPNLSEHFPALYQRMQRVDMMPWNLSLNFVGVPMLRHLPRCDWVLIRGGVFFDKMFFNPLYSYLLNFCAVLPYAARLNKPIVLYGVGVGPLNTPRGKRIMGWLGNKAALITTRDSDSLELLRELGVNQPRMALAADPAFGLRPVDAGQARAVCVEQGIDLARPLLGLNVTAFLDFMAQRGKAKLRRAAFVQTMAQVIDRLAETLGVSVVLTPTDVEGAIFQEIHAQVQRPEAVYLLDRSDLTPAQVAGVMGLMELMVGMRMHSLILALTAGTPCVGLVYNPKVAGLFKDLEAPELAFDLSLFGAEELYGFIARAWQQRNGLRPRLARAVGRLQQRAGVTKDMVRQVIYSATGPA